MRTIKNTISRIFSMSFHRFFVCINAVHKDAKKSKMSIFFDMIYCYLRYGIGYLDYLTYGFSYIKHDMRKTYMNMNHNLSLVRKMNNPSYRYMLDDKTEFCRIFSDMLKRDWLDLRKTDEETFLGFLHSHKVVFAKPINQFGGKGIIKITSDDIQLYEKLMEEQKYCIEEAIIQHPKMSLLFPGSVNSLRITTLLANDTVNVLYALIRIGGGDSYVDNISSGGMYSSVDENGVITADAFCDFSIEYFEFHPITKTRFKGFEIPFFKEAIALVKEAALRVKEIRYIGWDVAITEDGPVLIEGNTIPGYDMPQNYRHLGEHKEGLLPKIQNFIRF